MRDRPQNCKRGRPSTYAATSRSPVRITGRPDSGQGGTGNTPSSTLTNKQRSALSHHLKIDPPQQETILLSSINYAAILLDKGATETEAKLD